MVQTQKKIFCSKCDFKTNKNSYLIEHVNDVHENIKPYACSYEGCSYATRYKCGLKKHTEGVHLHLSMMQEKRNNGCVIIVCKRK